MVIAATGDDKANLVTSLLAKTDAAGLVHELLDDFAVVGVLDPREPERLLSGNGPAIYHLPRRNRGRSLGSAASAGALSRRRRGSTGSVTLDDRGTGGLGGTDGRFCLWYRTTSYYPTAASTTAVLTRRTTSSPGAARMIWRHERRHRDLAAPPSTPCLTGSAAPRNRGRLTSSATFPAAWWWCTCSVVDGRGTTSTGPNRAAAGFLLAFAGEAVRRRMTFVERSVRYRCLRLLVNGGPRTSPSCCASWPTPSSSAVQVRRACRSRLRHLA